MAKGFSEKVQAELVPDVGKPALPRTESFRLTLGPGGRIVIPADVRNRMGVKEGDMLVGQFDGKEMHVFSLAELVRRAQAAVEGAYPPGHSVVDEFVKERRALWGEDEPGRDSDK